MRQLLLVGGHITVADVPVPQVGPNHVLVRVAYSCVSIGTEIKGVRSSKKPVWKRVLTEPGTMRNGVEMLMRDGVLRTQRAVKEAFHVPKPVGYSVAGTVVAVGRQCEGFKVGDRVACAGGQCAYHAELVNIPRNLAVRIPEGVDVSDASTVALGSIALQGIRRLEPTLGEVFGVVGLGALGQLSTQILKANGCRVVGVDIIKERTEKALQLGADVVICPGDRDLVEAASMLSDGRGLDGVVITAAAQSNDVVSTALRMCRRKGRVVVVGDVGLGLNRADLYAKELDLLIATSYGPGRYDSTYEEVGQDYPFGYVRWTENRNMEAYLSLLGQERVKVRELIDKTCSLDEAPRVYEELEEGLLRPLVCLLQYPQKGETSCEDDPCTTVVRGGSALRRAVRIAVVGVGNFARKTHLPSLQSLASSVELRAVVSRKGHTAASAAREYGAAYASTDYGKVLDDDQIDAVMICTRHDLHARMVLDALRAGKHVYVEKPLALTREDLSEIQTFYNSAQSCDRPLLMTGFNRRFSILGQDLRSRIAERTNPMVLNYTVNAGRQPGDHWVWSPEGGGRNLGEACHMYDFLTYLVSGHGQLANVVSIDPRTGYYDQRDNFIATIRYSEGSIAVLTYCALGARSYPKERLDVFVDGQVLSVRDFRELHVFRGGPSVIRKAKPSAKGHVEAVSAFVRAVQEGSPWPIPLCEQIEATRIALDVEDFLSSRHKLMAD